MPVDLHHGDCLEVLARFASESVEAVVTDPPYGLSEHAPADVAECLRAWLAGQEYRPNKVGMMQRAWDAWVPGPEIWRECYRVLRPGGHMLVFAGSRSQDLMGMAIRLAGFEMRDTLSWMYSGGMPHGLNIGKAIAKTCGDEAAARWKGWNSTLKPNYEPILLARKATDGRLVRNVLTHGVGAFNVEACRVAGDLNPLETDNEVPGRYPGNSIHDGSAEVRSCFPSAPGARRAVAGTEPSNPAPNGIFNPYGRVASLDVRHDSDPSAARFFNVCPYTEHESRIYYAARVSAKEREGSKHLTMKPVSLMRHLCRLIAPAVITEFVCDRCVTFGNSAVSCFGCGVRLRKRTRASTILDPFAGSGSTGQAAVEEGCNAILIEREAEYVRHIEKRLALYLNHRQEHEPAAP